MIKRLFIMTGDASADVHASHIVQAYQRLNPGIEIQAIGDTHLKATGIPIFSDHQHMRAIGLQSILSAVPYHVGLGMRLIHYFKTQWRPDAVLLIDYGVFHLKMARHLKAMGIKVYYFIPPQVWASRQSRVKQIKRFVDHVFCIFPFELELYHRHGVPASFVGHPLVNTLPPTPDRSQFYQEHQLIPERPIIGLFPGSRTLEIQNLLQPMIEALPLIETLSGQKFHYLLARSPAVKDDVFNRYFEPIRSMAQRMDVRIIEGQNHQILSMAQAALVASGTVTLEAALYETPVVLSYKGPWIAWQFVKRMWSVKHIGLPNLLSQESERIVPELWMYDVTPYHYANELLPFLTDTPQRLRALAAFERIKQHLGSTSASENVVNAMIKIESGALDLNHLSDRGVTEKLDSSQKAKLVNSPF